MNLTDILTIIGIVVTAAVSIAIFIISRKDKQRLAAEASRESIKPLIEGAGGGGYTATDFESRFTIIKNTATDIHLANFDYDTSKISIKDVKIPSAKAGTPLTITGFIKDRAAFNKLRYKYSIIFSDIEGFTYEAKVEAICSSGYVKRIIPYSKPVVIKMHS